MKKKQEKQQMFVVSWVVFPFDILVCNGSGREDIVKYIKGLGYELDEEENEHLKMHGNGRTVMLKGGQTILWTRNKVKPGNPVLQHEIYHAVCFILDRVGIKISEHNDELAAYMIEYLTGMINKDITKQTRKTVV